MFFALAAACTLVGAALVDADDEGLLLQVATAHGRRVPASAMEKLRQRQLVNIHQEIDQVGKALGELDTPQGSPAAGANAKVAFLFLTRDKVLNEDVWDAFFEAAPAERYSVYVHRAASDASATSLARWGAVPVARVDSSWCHTLGPEVAVVARALRDPTNRQFVLVSGDAVPLKSFAYVYDQLLLKTPQTSKVCLASSAKFEDPFQHLYDEMAQGCEYHDNYNVQDHQTPLPLIKHHQWVILAREHAEVFARNAQSGLRAFEATGVRACTDEATPITATLLAMNANTSDKLEALKARKLEGFGMQENCLTFVHWRNCFVNSRFDLKEERMTGKDIAKVASAMGLGIVSQGWDAVARYLSKFWKGKLHRGEGPLHPKALGDLEYRYLEDLAGEAFMFARKFPDKAKVSVPGRGFQPLAGLLPGLWQAVDAERAARRVWTRLETTGQPLST